MCEILGFCAKQPYKLNDYLKVFFRRSDRHPDGWGMSVMDGNVSSIEKEPIQAIKSNYLKQRLTVPVEAESLFAHIRYATIGNLEYANCHPYTRLDGSGRRWTLIHNGTIFDYPPLNPYFYVQQGSTDSERILLYLVARIDELTEKSGAYPGFDERFTLLDSIICEMAEKNKLNLMIYDGEYMYVHTNCQDGLHFRKDADSILFATAALEKTGWKTYPVNTMAAFRKSLLVKEGRNHGHTFVMDEKEYKYLFQSFSGL